MLNLEPAEEHAAVAEVARSIGTEVLSPAARDAEDTGAVPRAAWKAVFETGLVVPVEEDRGGSGVPDTLTHLLAVENLAYGDPAIALAAAWSGAAAFLLGRYGRSEQDDLLASLLGDLDARGSVALYEGYGRGPGEYATTVTVAGDGGVRVVGRKVGVPFATVAAATIVIGADAESGALRAVVVPSGTPGVLVEPGSGRLALQAAGIASVSYDVTVPAANLLGGPELDPQSLARSVERIRLLLVAAEIGVSQRAVDYASNYAVDRIAFGKPISGFQGISFPLAEAQMRINELRLELGDVATRLDDDPFADNSAAVTKLVGYAGEVAAETTRTAVQTLGGHGFIVDHPVELWYRSAATLATFDFDLNRSSFVPAI
jgi:alkylation response protein AidB-like acyl-CoA dehydrogenase